MATSVITACAPVHKPNPPIPQKSHVVKKPKKKKVEPLLDTRCQDWKRSKISHPMYPDLTFADLIKKFNDHREHVRAQGAILLGTSKSLCALPYLLAGIEDSNDRIRYHSFANLDVVVVTNKENPELLEHIPKIIDLMLKHPHDRTRSSISATLSRIGPIILPALIDLLKKNDARSKEHSADAIALMTDDIEDKKIFDDAIKPLIDSMHFPDKEVQRSVFWALGSIGSKKATTALIDAVRYPHLAYYAIGALAHLRDKRAVPILKMSVNDENPEVRKQSARALGMIGHVDAIPALKLALSDPDQMVRYNSIEAIGKIAKNNPSNKKIKHLLPIIIKFLDDPSRKVRFAAIRALREFNDKRALAPLRKLFRTTPDSFTKREIKTSIAIISR